MIYFSELAKKKVYTQDMTKVGVLEDIIFLAEHLPFVTKIVIKSDNYESLFIPIEQVEKLNGQIIINKNYETVPLAENELHIVKNLLDKQIIDIGGNKIVRVNDVALQDKGKLLIAGVDTGLLGIVRWFQLESILFKILRPFNIHIKPSFLPWGDIQPLELVRGQVKLRKEEDKLQKIRPEDLADHLEATNVKNVKKLLGLLDDNQVIEVINNLSTSYQVELFKDYDAEQAAKIMALMDPDEAADILLALSTKKREAIIEHLHSDKKKQMLQLLKLSENPVGDLITPAYITASPENTVKQMIDKIKKETADFKIFTAVYIINHSEQIIGVVGIHDLLMQNLDTPAYKFMIQNIIVGYLNTPVDIVFKKMLKYSLASIPVIDDERHILGIITLDDIASYILEKIGS